MSLLQIRNLKIRFSTNDGDVHAVNDVSLTLNAGQKLALVGESGSGKSQIALSILGLSAKNALKSGEILFQGQNLLTLSEQQLNPIRTRKIAMIFQDPMSALNPYMTVGRQLSEIVEHHEGLSRRDAYKRAIEAMQAVQIPDAEKRAKSYPHAFSGGMRQRIVIAMALICKPDIILADEPTTALDVTVQAQIMQLLDDIQRQTQCAILLITHDLGVVAGFCDDAMVLYGGRVMEKAPVKALFKTPTHPYTESLLAAVPNIHDENAVLKAIAGQPPSQKQAPTFCPYAPRCGRAAARCYEALPKLEGGPVQTACFAPLEAGS